jgi:hypothetical protein
MLGFDLVVMVSWSGALPLGHHILWYFADWTSRLNYCNVEFIIVFLLKLATIFYILGELMLNKMFKYESELCIENQVMLQIWIDHATRVYYCSNERE